MLAPGGAVTLVDGRQITVVRELGRGGQGVVYEARAASGEAWALKWYLGSLPGQRQVLADLIDRGAPSERFLWPLALTAPSPDGRFGYTMALRPEGFAGLADLLRGRDRDGSPVSLPYRSALRLCAQLARSFQKLHAKGLCYRDLNFGNVFFHRGEGDALVCDNDNVGIDGTPGLVLGVPEFMAPEVIRLLVPGTPGLARPPSASSDLHSLAVVLFYVLLQEHPLRGAKTDEGVIDAAWAVEHFATDPVFVFSPADARNRPLTAGAADRWERYPRFLRELFTTAFTAGLGDPDARVREGQWVSALLRLRDATLSCSCGATAFIDPDGPPPRCARCGATVEPAGWLRIGSRRVALGPGARVWSDHLGDDPDRSVPVAEVIAHPAQPDLLGVRNLTATPWAATDPKGRVHQVAPGRAVSTTRGLRLDLLGGQAVVEVDGARPPTSAPSSAQIPRSSRL